QEEKAARAQVVIQNVAGFEDTWKQVVAAWQKMVPAPGAAPVKPTAANEAATRPVKLPEGEMTIMRGTPRHSAMIATLINRLKRPAANLKPEDIMAAFGEKAFLIIQMGDTPVGVIGWQVENLVSRTNEIYLDPLVPLNEALPTLIKEMETASRELQCEASLVFAPMELSQNDTIWSKMGYERRSPQTLGVMAWQEAALENLNTNTVLYFKQLRQDRILRPI
ncbi:MAG: hypothetical protein HGA53_04950, partial [Anaerolineaceae bacterium]|nr:hypothetical protein [Anaerolineaceae bacterium]